MAAAVYDGSWARAIRTQHKSRIKGCGGILFPVHPLKTEIMHRNPDVAHKTNEVCVCDASRPRNWNDDQSKRKLSEGKIMEMRVDLLLAFGGSSLGKWSEKNTMKLQKCAFKQRLSNFELHTHTTVVLINVEAKAITKSTAPSNHNNRCCFQQNQTLYCYSPFFSISLCSQLWDCQ